MERTDLEHTYGARPGSTGLDRTYARPGSAGMERPGLDRTYVRPGSAGMERPGLDRTYAGRPGSAGMERITYGPRSGSAGVERGVLEHMYSRDHAPGGRYSETPTLENESIRDIQRNGSRDRDRERDMYSIWGSELDSNNVSPFSGSPIPLSSLTAVSVIDTHLDNQYEHQYEQELYPSVARTTATFDPMKWI